MMRETMGATKEGRVFSVNVSEERGEGKKPVGEAVINEFGISGDSHAGAWTRQVSILAREELLRFQSESGRTVLPGEFAENITAEGLELSEVALLDRLRVGEAELEVTEIGGGKLDASACSIGRELGDCLMPGAGLFCRVVSGGCVRPGDKLEFVPRPLRFQIITLDDDAASGEHPDRTGPAVRKILEEFMAPLRWHPDIRTKVLPLDVQFFRQELVRQRDENVDVVFTVGGTGVGPRHIAPDVVADLADRTIPGIMEHIRLKYGADNPNALLSRSVAAVMDSTVVYAMPGGVKAVTEYMVEILRSMESAIKMLHGIGH